MTLAVGYVPDLIPPAVIKALHENEVIGISDNDNFSSTLLALNISRYFINRIDGYVIYLFTKNPKFFNKLLQANTLSKKKSRFSAFDIRRPFFIESKIFPVMSYINLADFFKELYSIIFSLQKGSPLLVVLDNVDYIVNSLKLGESAIFDFIKRFVELLNSVNAVPVILTTNSDLMKKYLDIFTNLCIELRRENYNGRLLLYAFVQKMDPVDLQLPVFIFTTNDYTFRYFKEMLFEIAPSENCKNAKKGKTFKKDLFPTPIKELNKITNGGLRPGDVVILEIDPLVYKYYRHIIFPIEHAFIENEHPCIIIPSKGTSHILVKNVFKKFTSHDKIKWLRYVSFDYIINDEIVLNISKGTLLEDIKRILRYIKASMEGKTALFYISLNRFLDEYSLDELNKSLGRLITLIRETKNIAIISVPSTLPEKLAIPPVNYNFKIILSKNTPVFYGLNPITSLFVPTVKINCEFKVDLVPIK